MSNLSREEKFWRKVNMTKDCWEWIGHKKYNVSYSQIYRIRVGKAWIHCV